MYFLGGNDHKIKFHKIKIVIWHKIESLICHKIKSFIVFGTRSKALIMLFKTFDLVPKVESSFWHKIKSCNNGILGFFKLSILCQKLAVLIKIKCTVG